MFDEQRIKYDRIMVRYDGTLDKSAIMRRLNLPPSGTVSPDKLNEAIMRVYGMQLFSDVTYKLAQLHGEDVLVVTATSAADGSLVPSFGIILDNSFGGNGNFTLGLGASIAELNSLGGRLDIDATIGNVEGGRVRFEQPLDIAQQFIIRPVASYFRTNADLYAKPDDLLSPIEISTLRVGSEAFFVPGDWGRVGVGLSYDQTTTETEIGNIPGTNQSRRTTDQIVSSLIFDYDDLDDVDLPSSGSQLSMRYDLDLLQPEKKGAATFDGLTAWSLGQHVVSPFGYASGNMSNDGFSANFIGRIPAAFWFFKR
jgi:Outer membrane protein/protective antigen OMA87